MNDAEKVATAEVDPDFDQILENIKNALDSMDGEEIATIHNQLCLSQIKYVEDSVWEEIREEN